MNLFLIFPLQCSAGSVPKKGEEPVAAGNLDARYSLVRDETFDVCLGYNGTTGASIDCKVIVQNILA